MWIVTWEGSFVKNGREESATYKFKVDDLKTAGRYLRELLDAKRCKGYILVFGRFTKVQPS